MATKTRFLGLCPVCQGEFKLVEKGPSDPLCLVHHGYQRPGYGYIVGDCFGVGYPSYQRSSQGCVEYLKAVKSQLEREQKTLESIDSGEAKEAWVKRRVGFGHSELVRITPEDPKFNEALAIFRTMVVGAIRDCGREITRMDKLIADWTEKSTRTVEESARESNIQKAARAAEREAKRAEARAKQAVLAAKQKARVAEKQALIAKYQARFEALAAGLESVGDRKRQARWDWVDMQKAMSRRAYLHFFEGRLECDEALKTLGLAEQPRPDSAFVRYADKNGLL